MGKLIPIMLFILVSCFLHPLAAAANDSAAETAAGGLQLRNERRVAMIKERLFIGKTFLREDSSNIPSRENRFRIAVEYEFLNESAEDVITEVAFPLPEFRYRYEDLNGIRKIRGFTVEADGRKVDYQTDVRALVKGRDVTELLRKSGIEIETFGRYEGPDAPRPGKYQVDRLPKNMQDALKAAGAVSDELWPQWSAAVTYHWKQTFPAGKVVRVKHEYDAIPGFSYGSRVEQYLAGLENGCFDPGLVRALEAAHERTSKSGRDALVWSEWVKYILTTANTWKTPIRDFELIVERPRGQFVSFCWDGPVEKLSDTRFRATARNYVPQRELQIYFLSVVK
ncbi:MAG: DUF4424 family protein [Candidatus Latescibacterota bacterium]